MKVCIIQPKYEMDHSRTPDISAWILDALDKCDPTMDLIVLPESSDVPCFAKDEAEMMASYEANNRRLIGKCSETARRCSAVLFVNANHRTPTGLRNTTYAFDRTGAEVGHYYKQHLTPGETTHYHLDSDYTFEYEDTTVIEIDGIRVADNGDNSPKEREWGLAKCPPTDIIISSTWSWVTNIVTACAAAPGFQPERAVFLPSHENDAAKQHQHGQQGGKELLHGN